MSASRIAILTAIAIFLFCAGRDLSSWLGHSPGPRMEITPAEINLGTVALGQPVQRNFLLRNIGETRLLITDVKSTCQCTVAELASRAIAPGGTVELRVTFKAKYAGSIRQGILVRTNEPTMATHLLKVLAEAGPATKP